MGERRRAPARSGLAARFPFAGAGQNRRIGEDTDKTLPYLCECGDIGCEKCVPLTAREYDELPADGRLALAEGHELED